MLNRNVTRTVLNSTETTADTQDLSGSELSFVFETDDFFYVGFIGKFGSRYFDVGTANTNSASLTVEYWNGAWTAVEDLIDQTVGLTQSGFLSWVNQNDWRTQELTPVSDRELYWIRISTDANFSAGTTLKSVSNLFSDDVMLRQIYPELVNDSRYLPTSRTDFLEQHRAAKNLCVLRLKQRRLVEDESQIIDINAVATAAVHACAYYIYAAIASNEITSELRDDALKSFEREIRETKLNVDQNRDGIVSEGERRDISSTFVRVR